MWRRFFYSVLFLAIVSGLLYFWTPPGSTPDPEAQCIAKDGLAAVSILPERVRILGYDRSKFGNGWAKKVDRAGDYCSTRELVLNQSFDTSPPATGESCPRAIGTASDEYTAGSIEPSATDIDHIFPLAAAWDLGAHAWDDAKRQEFANDWQFNLALTASNVNREKSDATLSTWLPPLPEARCPYVARFLLVAQRYQLAITAADAESARRECQLSEG